MAFKDAVKQWFLTGKKPDQSEFFQQFEWLRWNDQKIPIADIQDLPEYLANITPPVIFEILEDTAYEIPEGYAVSKMYLTAQLECFVTIATDEEGELLTDLQLFDNKTMPINIDVVAQDEPRILYITNIVSPTKIQIHLNKI